MDAQGLDRFVALRKHGRSVPLVSIHIDDPDGSHIVVGLEFTSCDDDVVEKAEPAASIPLAVVPATAEVEAETRLEGQFATLVRARDVRQ